MLRELNLNEMKAVSGGQNSNSEEDVVITTDVRHTADDGGTVGLPGSSTRQ